MFLTLYISNFFSPLLSFKWQVSWYTTTSGNRGYSYFLSSDHKFYFLKISYNPLVLISALRLQKMHRVILKRNHHYLVLEFLPVGKLTALWLSVWATVQGRNVHKERIAYLALFSLKNGRLKRGTTTTTTTTCATPISKYKNYYLRNSYRMFFMSPEDKPESQGKKYSLNECSRMVLRKNSWVKSAIEYCEEVSKRQCKIFPLGVLLVCTLFSNLFHHLLFYLY